MCVWIKCNGSAAFKCKSIKWDQLELRNLQLLLVASLEVK